MNKGVSLWAVFGFFVEFVSHKSGNFFSWTDFSGNCDVFVTFAFIFGTSINRIPHMAYCVNFSFVGALRAFSDHATATVIFDILWGGTIGTWFVTKSWAGLPYTNAVFVKTWAITISVVGNLDLMSWFRTSFWSDVFLIANWYIWAMIWYFDIAIWAATSSCDSDEFF